MWSPPAAPISPSRERVRGALAGSLLYDQPRHAPIRSAILDFCAAPGPVVFEVGFDHGMRILGAARAEPEVRFLGAELRARRVAAAAPHAPANCMLLHADARTLLATVIPVARLDRIDILFPTPTDRPRHLLLTPTFADAVARALAPGGILHLLTDVPAMHLVARSLFPWAPAPAVASYALSRRERVCRRDGIPILAHTVRR